MATEAGRRLAIIGTAGRDRSQTMDRALWNAMTADLQPRLQPGDVLVSGGAAWADHLAVHAFLQGWCAGLELYLPAPFEQAADGTWRFVGPARSAASAGNFYHDKFRRETGVDSCAQIAQSIAMGAKVDSERAAAGFGAMFARNKKVAQGCSSVLAYTFGEGVKPADGGTLNTWSQIGGPDKVHVSLLRMRERMPRGQSEQQATTARGAAPETAKLSRAERFKGQQQR